MTDKHIDEMTTAESILFILDMVTLGEPELNYDLMNSIQKIGRHLVTQGSRESQQCADEIAIVLGAIRQLDESKRQYRAETIEAELEA